MKKENHPVFIHVLQCVANLQHLAKGLIRIAIFIIFVWIGGLKFFNYEAEGIVPFVANSPFMSFFYNEKAPEYRQFKLKEGEFDADKHAWHEANGTYRFSRGLGILIMGIGFLTLLGFFSLRAGMAGELLAAEARRLLLYTDMTAKEIGDLLGFVDNAAFSRFFRKMGGISISDFRKKNMYKRIEPRLPENSSV